MAIRARTLTVYNYRSFLGLELELAPGTTVLVGHNAAGKTNLVEALQLLTAGQSFRKPSPRELVREGADAGFIELALEGEGRHLDMRCELTPRKRGFERNGKKTTAAGVRGVLPSVLFCPDHLDMIKRSASVRRAALDDFGMQLNERYAQLVGSYERVVEQRNNLLKERSVDRGLLAAWDESLVATGSALMSHRMALLGRVRDHFVRIYGSIAPHETVDVAYVPSVVSSENAQPDPSAPVLGREQIDGLFRSALAAHEEDELRRGITLVGPHRDELLFTIDGRSARSFGSQGQQRSLVLAWKIAEVEVTRDILGRAPILLLDDVMSELDAGRRAAILSFVGDEIQTVITTTNLGYFDDEVLERAKVVGMDGLQG